MKNWRMHKVPWFVWAWVVLALGFVNFSVTECVFDTGDDGCRFVITPHSFLFGLPLATVVTLIAMGIVALVRHAVQRHQNLH